MVLCKTKTGDIVYMNPKSIERMNSDIRGVVDKDGNLYILDNAHDYIHSDIYQIVSKYTSIHQYPYINKDEIPVVRLNKTNFFYLGESYYTREIDDNIDLIKSILTKCKTVNPTIEFIPVNILYADLLVDNKKII